MNIDLPTVIQVMETDSFIGGEYAKTLGRIADFKNPATNGAYAIVTIASPSVMQQAVQAAREAFDRGPWPKMSPKERGEILRRMAALLGEEAEYFAAVEALNVGKLYSECVHHEVPRAVENFQFFADLFSEEKIERFEKEVNFLGRKGKIESIVLREPVGVVGIIIPWNSPLLLGSWNIAPCLAAGNTCVVKPSPRAPLSLLQFGEIAREAGLPPGVLNIVAGDDEAGDALVRDERVKLISFTGSPQVGQRIKIADAQVNLCHRYMPPILELGGKAPNIVFPDADIDFAVKGVARSIFRSQGQSCVAGSRLLVAGPIYAEFMEKLIAYIKTWKIGSQFNPETQLGPLITKQHLERVEEYILSGINEGARLRYGGNRPQDLRQGNFLEPTIFDRIDSSMRIWREEIFGPVLVASLFPWLENCSRQDEYEKELIAMANDTKYGLSANIWTQDMEKAMRIAMQLDTAMIWINGHFLRDLRAPFGGRKASGYGRQGGEWSRDSFMQTKMICAAHYS